MEVAARLRKNKENDHDDERNRQHQLELDIFTEARIVVVRSVKSKPGPTRAASLQLRQQILDAVTT